MDIPAHRAERVGIFMKMEELSVLYALNSFIDIEQRNGIQGLADIRAAAASYDSHDSGFLQLLQQLSDDDRVCVYAGCKEVAGYFVFFFKGLNSNDYVDS